MAIIHCGYLVIGAVEFVNNLIVHNAYGGLSCNLRGGPPIMIECNDVWGEGASWTGDCAPYVGTGGNFSANPLFCDPAAGDYRLSPLSPCAPENSPAGCGLIGALPACGTTSVVVDAAPDRGLGLLVRPNPVLAGASFLVEAPEQRLLLEIYSASGRLIESLEPKARTWLQWTPPARLPGGVYLARIVGENRSQVARFVVLR